MCYIMLQGVIRIYRMLHGVSWYYGVSSGVSIGNSMICSDTWHK